MKLTARIVKLFPYFVCCIVRVNFDVFVKFLFCLMPSEFHNQKNINSSKEHICSERPPTSMACNFFTLEITLYNLSTVDMGDVMNP